MLIWSRVIGKTNEEHYTIINTFKKLFTGIPIPFGGHIDWSAFGKNATSGVGYAIAQSCYCIHFP